MSTSETITRTDLTNILNEVLPTPRYGAVYSASWTADSSSANDVKLTNTLTLTAGTYVISVKYPSVSTTLWTVVKYDDGTSVGGVLDNYAIFSGGSSSSNAFVINLTTDRTIWVASGMSTSCTYSYKERGGLRAIQISESSVHSNEADYIVEQGTSGIWTYRKWNSGLYEAWTSYDATGLTLTTSSAGTYYSSSGYKDLALPSFSLSVTNALYSNRQSQSSGVYVYDTEISGSNLRVWYRAHASASNVNCGAYFEIKGTWK